MAVKSFHVPNNDDNYIFIPACCYSGNQFDVLPYKWPPMFKPEEAGTYISTTITNVPRLEKDGGGKIEVTTGDAATPCVGVFSESEKRGVLIFTVQQIGGKNVGLAYENGQIRLTWPAKREKIYRFNCMIDNPQEWVDEPAEIPYKLLDFSCESLAEFYRVFFKNRKIMNMDSERTEVLPVDKQAKIQIEKFNFRSGSSAGQAVR